MLRLVLRTQARSPPTPSWLNQRFPCGLPRRAIPAKLRPVSTVSATTAICPMPATSAALPGQLFYSTQIPVCLWFLAKCKNADAKRQSLPNSAMLHK